MCAKRERTAPTTVRISASTSKNHPIFDQCRGTFSYLRAGTDMNVHMHCCKGNCCFIANALFVPGASHVPAEPLNPPQCPRQELALFLYEGTVKTLQGEQCAIDIHPNTHYIIVYISHVTSNIEMWVETQRIIVGSEAKG